MTEIQIEIQIHEKTSDNGVNYYQAVLTGTEHKTEWGLSRAGAWRKGRYLLAHYLSANGNMTYGQALGYADTQIEAAMPKFGLDSSGYLVFNDTKTEIDVADFHLVMKDIGYWYGSNVRNEFEQEMNFLLNIKRPELILSYTCVDNEFWLDTVLSSVWNSEYLAIALAHFSYDHLARRLPYLSKLSEK